MRKIVIASDSYKGCLSSLEVASAIAKGIKSVYPNCNIIQTSIADGGEGMVDAVIGNLGGYIVKLWVSDPLGRPINASYGIIDDGKTAVLEMSSASGLPLLSQAERNPMLTSTVGTGELIMDAISKGCRRFCVGIGGSATNDAGIGMLSALGFRFLGSDGKVVRPCGGSLGDIASIDTSSVPAEVLESEFLVACDVNTLFCGPAGAAYVFAPQKGADPEMVKTLDAGMDKFANLVYSQMHKNIRNLEGAGAAGGLGGGFSAFLNARLMRGIDMVLDTIGFDELIQGADLVITGEGSIDNQTALGKTPAGVLARAARQNIPVIAFGGSVSHDADTSGFAACFPILDAPVSLEQAMVKEYAADNLTRTATQVMHLIKVFK